jgi:hypothetical protein
MDNICRRDLDAPLIPVGFQPEGRHILRYIQNAVEE